MLLAAIDQHAINIPQYRIFTTIDHPGPPPSLSLCHAALIALSRSIPCTGIVSRQSAERQYRPISHL